MLFHVNEHVQSVLKDARLRKVVSWIPDLALPPSKEGALVFYTADNSDW